MTLRLTADDRDRLKAIRSEEAAILKPLKLAQRAERKAADRAKPKREKRIHHDTGKQTRGRVVDKGYLAYLRRQPCEACGTGNRVEAAHIRSGYAEAGWPPTGMQVKPSDFRALSLCAVCHREGPDAQHRGNERLWWQARGIYPPERCAQVRADFLAGRDQGSSHAGA